VMASVPHISDVNQGRSIGPTLARRPEIGPSHIIRRSGSVSSNQSFWLVCHIGSFVGGAEKLFAVQPTENYKLCVRIPTTQGLTLAKRRHRGEFCHRLLKSNLMAMVRSHTPLHERKVSLRPHRFQFAFFLRNFECVLDSGFYQRLS